MKSIELLSEMVAFPSVSSTSNVDVSRWVENQLKSRGFRTEWLSYTDSRGIEKVCVSGQIGPTEGRGLAYFCHSDVVPVSTWSFPESGPWNLLQKDSRLYGRGSCDMKGSLICMLSAVDAVSSTQLNAPLTIVCTADEEVGLQGARHVVAESKMYRELAQRRSRAIIGEPTLLNVVHAHKGGRSLRITSKGIAAHSSTGKGVNANFAMIPFLAEVNQLCERIKDDPQWQDDRYHPPTINLNLGINDHTTAINITPAQSICTIYFRTMPGINADALVDEIQAAAERHCLEFEIVFQGNPLFTDPDSNFIAELLELSGKSVSQTVSYGTDGSCFTELTDIAVVGPGDIRQAHTDDEWIEVEQLSQGTALYEKFIRRWCV